MKHSTSMRVILSSLAVLTGTVVALAGTPDAFIVVKDGDAVSGSTISTLNTPFTDGNGTVGFVAGLADGNNIIWYGLGPIFNSDDALPDDLSGGEGTMGVSDTGGFIYSPSFNGFDSVYTHAGKLLAEDDDAPGVPANFSSFNSRPTMLPNGTAHWVGGYTDTLGGATDGRVMYEATDVSNPGTITPLLKTGDLVNGFAITSSGIGFDYDFSDNGSNHIFSLILDTGSTNTDDFIYVNGATVAQEDTPTGGGDDWDNFDAVSINNLGNYLFSGDTDGSSTTDEFLAYNGVISLREGDVVDGVTLEDAVHWASINDLGQAAFIWNSSLEETLFFGDAANLASSIALLSVGDIISQDGVDYEVTDFNASNIISPGLDLAEDGLVYVEVDLVPVAGGDELEAIVGVVIPEPSTLALLALGVVALVGRR